MSKVLKVLYIIYIYTFNGMHVKGVKRSSKYIHTHIFAHNFLNIQLIFNAIEVLESWDLGLSNHNIKFYIC